MTALGSRLDRRYNHKMPTRAQRFWSKTKRRGACIVWTGSKKSGSLGYGFFGGGDKLWMAHRWIWTQAVGPIAPGMEIMHSCNEPSCVALQHMSLGTRQKNAKRGKLSNVQVAEIRARHAAGEKQQALADAFGVRDSTISRIVNRVRRKEPNWARPDDQPE